MKLLPHLLARLPNFIPFLALLLKGCKVDALVEADKSGTVAENELINPDVKDVWNTEYLGAEDLPQDVQERVSSIEEAFGLHPRSTFVDSRSGRIASIFPSSPILPGNGVKNGLAWGKDGNRGKPQSYGEWEEASVQAFKRWLTKNEAILDVDVSNELFINDDTRVAVHGEDGDLIQIYSPRTFNGIPVTGSCVQATIKLGNLISVGFQKWGSIPQDFSVEPRITAEDALDKVQDQAGYPLAGNEWCESELQILTMLNGPSGAGKLRRVKAEAGETPFGEGYKHKLVYKVCPSFEDQEYQQMEGYVDAETGELYSFEDKVDYFESKGGVYPASNDGISPDGVLKKGWPMPFMNVGVETTDTGGNYFNTGVVTGEFSGPYLHIIDLCGWDGLTASGGLSWGGSSGTDCSTPGFGGPGNTQSSRTGFYELNKIMEIARSRLPSNAWLSNQLKAVVNLNLSPWLVCNAFWFLGTIWFLQSHGDCANTGEIASVLDHEWGHGMDANDVTPGISSPSGEGIADVYAALRLNDSCIGRGFTSNPCTGNGDPCLTCTGVRDIDYMMRDSGLPHTLTWAMANCGGSVHCLGGTYAEAIWSLYARILPNMYGYDLITSLEIVTRLTYIAAGNVATWFTLSPPFGGCGSNSGYRSFLAADDDDGNISNGTPHMEGIYAAFNDQEIACPSVVTGSTCGAPVGKPVVTATPGNMAVHLSWTTVLSVDSYQIFRTEGVFGCNLGRVKIGETTGTSFIDTGLQNNRDYYYVVIPKGSNDACWGHSSKCTVCKPMSAIPIPTSKPTPKPTFGKAEPHSPTE